LLSACLDSIVRNLGQDLPCETVIVLNGSPEPVRRLVHDEVSGATVVESAVNRGVAGGYNLARGAARGELLVVLHDDTEVWPGWLEALVAAADERPDAGAVGSKALNADGTLQSAGARVLANGRTEPLGRGEPADARAFQQRTEVDYSGSNSLLVRAATWDAVGGMDERFFPAYHVDVDLGTAIRALGQVVLYEPVSVVTHHRWGATTDERFRAFAASRNLARYVAKWQSESGLSEDTPSSELDYLRLDLELKDAYIRELNSEVDVLRGHLSGIEESRTWRAKRMLSRLAAASRKRSFRSVDRSGTYPDARDRTGESES
jgi:GT2 family glycosyltransferase